MIGLQDCDGRSALMRACEAGSPKCAQKLLQYESHLIDQKGRTALEAAAEAGSLECCQLMASAGEDLLFNQKNHCQMAWEVAWKH